LLLATRNANGEYSTDDYETESFLSEISEENQTNSPTPYRAASDDEPENNDEMDL